MRVSSSLIALCAVLFACAAAEEPLHGRMLADRVKADTRAKGWYTDTFNWSKTSYGPDETFEGGMQVGLIVGFISTGIFMIFAVSWLIYDEVKRHETFKRQVEEDWARLQRYVGSDPEDKRKYELEFAEREATRKMSKAEAEAQRKALAAVN